MLAETTRILANIYIAEEVVFNVENLPPGLPRLKRSKNGGDHSGKQNVLNYHLVVETLILLLIKLYKLIELSNQW